MAKKIKLSRHESIIGIEPRVCAGPGWGNSPMCIHIVDKATGKYRLECLQPEDRTKEMAILFPILLSAYNSMLNEVNTIVKQPTK
jgi:hypothetical protein